MLEKKATSIAIIVALLSTLFLVQFTTIVAQTPPEIEYDWETAFISSPQNLMMLGMFSDFRAENLHFSITLPTGGPSSPLIQLTFDVKEVETSTGGEPNSLHLEAEKVCLSILPLDSVAPVEVEIEADELTLDLAFWPGDIDEETGQFGELTFKLKKNVKFRFDLDPMPDWWNPPTLWKKNKFTGRVVFLQPDYDITFDPDPIMAYPACQENPSSTPITVHVDPNRFYNDVPVTDLVWLQLRPEDGRLGVEYNGSLAQTPPCDWNATVRVNAGLPHSNRLIAMLTGASVPPDQCSTEVDVEVVPRFLVELDIGEYPPGPPINVTVLRSQHENDWKQTDLWINVTANTGTNSTPGPQPVTFYCEQIGDKLYARLTNASMPGGLLWGTAYVLDVDEPIDPIHVRLEILSYNAEPITTTLILRIHDDCCYDYIIPIDLTVVLPPEP